MRQFSKGLCIFIAASAVIGSNLSCCSSEPNSKTPAISRDGVDAGAAPTAAAERAPMLFEGPGEKLPRAPEGWKLSGAPRYFGPDNLYDLINGGAEIYVGFGLVKMVTAEYRHADGSLSLTAEIYDMGSPLGAFGRTARFLEGLVDPSAAGKGLEGSLAKKGILGDGDLVFWRDRYLVHLTLLDERPDATAGAIAAAGAKHLPSFAAEITAAIPADPPVPEIFAGFGADHRIGRSEAWHPEDLLGIAGLGGGFTVRYADGETTWTAFATEELDEAGTAAAWAAARGAEAQGRTVVLKAAGRRLVGLSQDGGPPMSDALVERLAEGMKESFAAR